MFITRKTYSKNQVEEIFQNHRSELKSNRISVLKYFAHGHKFSLDHCSCGKIRPAIRFFLQYYSQILHFHPKKKLLNRMLLLGLEKYSKNQCLLGALLDITEILIVVQLLSPFFSLLLQFIIGFSLHF